MPSRAASALVQSSTRAQGNVFILFLTSTKSLPPHVYIVSHSATMLMLGLSTFLEDEESSRVGNNFGGGGGGNSFANITLAISSRCFSILLLSLGAFHKVLDLRASLLQKVFYEGCSLILVICLIIFPLD